MFHPTFYRKGRTLREPARDARPPRRSPASRIPTRRASRTCTRRRSPTARGLPKPRTTFTAGENERRTTAHAERVMRDVWPATGAREVWAFSRKAYTIGTCRTGADPPAAVVDADGRAFAVPNLYVSDNSTFPSALAVSPALTIMAVALRTADRFLASAGRREA